MPFKYFLKKITQTRKILQKFRQAGAFTPDFAKPLKDLGLGYSPPLNKLIRNRVIVDAGQRNYYLDERAMLHYRMKRTKWIFVLVLIILFIFLSITK
jgi:hypothetical protein